MLTQSLVLDYLSKPVRQPFEVSKGFSSGEKKLPEFKQALDNSVDRMANRDCRKELSGQSHKEAAGSGTQNYRTIKSYRDAVKSREQNSQPKSADSRIERLDKDGKSFKKATSKAAGEINSLMEQSFAAVLGITPEELRKIMLSLDIEPQELTGGVKTDEIASKIAGLLDLDSGEEKTLSQILVFTKKKLEELNENVMIQSYESTGTQIFTEDNSVDEAAGTDNTNTLSEIEPAERELDIQELGSKLKAVLKNLKDKTRDKPELLLENITRKFKFLKTDISVSKVTGSDARTVEAIDEELNAFASDSSEEGLESSISHQGAESEESSEEKSSEQNSGLPLKVLTRNPGEEFKQQDSSELEFGSIAYFNNQKADSSDKVSVLEKQVSVNRKEIVTQVIDKAKVLLSGDKSEMVINMKPDHLGKLELKIVTERGMVVAKFIAESEQVKAALEANMDTLKQSLEKQGFSVQGFSVSVGKDAQRGYNPNSGFLGNRPEGGTKEKIGLVNAVNSIAYSEGNQRSNPYELSDSSINLTA
ncbi:MAG: flagellar hook-length control protein FliK [Clostridiaceae bacterium]|nr:flagellar hook-length control protein FliK [Clostridiaceae bacterium]